MDHLRARIALLLLWFRARYRSLPASVRAGWVTAWAAFVGQVVVVSLGVLQAIMDAIEQQRIAVFLDHMSAASSLALAAVSSLIYGLVNTIYRVWRPVGAAYVTDEQIDGRIVELARLADERRRE